MAREASVPFLGSVPLDTGFGALVEGVTEEQNAATSDASANGTASERPTELVERYRACGLCPIFAGFAKTVDQKVQGTRTSGNNQ